MVAIGPLVSIQRYTDVCDVSLQYRSILKEKYYLCIRGHLFPLSSLHVYINTCMWMQAFIRLGHYFCQCLWQTALLVKSSTYQCVPSFLYNEDEFERFTQSAWSFSTFCIKRYYYFYSVSLFLIWKIATEYFVVYFFKGSIYYFEMPWKISFKMRPRRFMFLKFSHRN